MYLLAGSSITNGLNPLNNSTDPLPLFIVQLLLIVIISRVLAYFLSFIKQPPVISEVITGILLGPSVLGQSSKFSNNVFPASGMPVLNVTANVGLIFFMFMVGLEVDFSVLKKNLKQSLTISLTSIVIPFGLGIGLAALIHDKMVADVVSFPLFCIFVGVAISITAFPVLARILTERKIIHSKVGVTALAAASVDDVIAWILLAVVVSYAKNVGPNAGGTTGSTNSNLTALWTFLLMLGFIGLCFGPLKMALAHIHKKYVKTETQKHQMLIVLLMLMFAAAFFTEVIGVHAIFGGFIIGICVPRHEGFHQVITERIEDVVTIVLLPLYFTFSGLRTNLSSINTGTAGGLTVFIIFIAIIGKVGGATLASRFVKNSWRESITVGFLMNTKGLVELIALNIGLDIGILNQTLFTMFVVMALVTTFMTTPIVHFLWTRYEIAQNRQPMVPTSNFKTLIYVSTTRIGAALTNLAGCISSSESKKQYKTKAMFINQIAAGRPSNYFFNSVKNLPPQRREAFLAVESEAKNLGIKVKPCIINSEDVCEDIVSVTHGAWPDMVMVGYTKENTEGSVLEVVPEPFYNKSLLKVLENVKSCVGVVVDKGLDRFHKQHEILAIFTGAEYENDAITVLFKMARRKNVNVTVLTNNAEIFANRVQTHEKLDISRFNIIPSNSPYEELVEKVQEKPSHYWLALLGASRENATSQERLINATNVSLFIIHPANTLRGLDSASTSKSVDHNDHLGIELQNQKLTSE